MRSFFLWMSLIISSVFGLLNAQNPSTEAALLLSMDGDSAVENEVNLEMKLETKAISYTTDRFGDEHKAIYFDGEQSEVKVPIDVNSDRLPEMTVILWAKTERPRQSGTIFSQDNGDYDRTLAIDNRSGDGWTWSAFCGSKGVMGGKQVRANIWTFLALIYDQENEEVVLFVNGDWYNKEGSLGLGWEYFKLGKNPSFFTPFRGSMDDIRLYDQRLNRSTIEAIYEREKEGVYIPDWERQEEITATHPHADYLVRVGDIDNLGFGWPPGFDPFSGRSTEAHDFPYQPESDDYPGTDRIMVGSSYNGKNSKGRDGYAYGTKRPDNRPMPIRLNYPSPEVEIEEVVLQLFIDDFQAPVFGSSFQVELDGKRIPYLENILNSIEQTGPIGKLITVSLLPQHHDLVSDGTVEISIDDPWSGAGDGYALDFARILFNPKDYPYKGIIEGRVVDHDGVPISGALVSAGNIRQEMTDASGHFSLKAVPAGLANVTAIKSGYTSDRETLDLLNGQVQEIELRLKERESESSDYIRKSLETSGKTDLYGIYFETDKDQPKPESTPTLNALLRVLENDPDLQLTIAGHTDSDGSISYNRDLSLRRAESVVSWLIERGISTDRLRARGYGETSPVASNTTSEGKALNRRVEVQVLIMD